MKKILGLLVLAGAVAAAIGALFAPSSCSGNGSAKASAAGTTVSPAAFMSARNASPAASKPGTLAQSCAASERRRKQFLRRSHPKLTLPRSKNHRPNTCLYMTGPLLFYPLAHLTPKILLQILPLRLKTPSFLT